MKRTPRWAVEAVAWSAALVLLGGVVVAVSGVIDTKPAVAAPDVAPVVDTPAPPPSPAPKPKPQVAQPPTKVTVQPRANTGVPRAASLGPPPGPFNDPVPARTAAPEDRYALLVGITNYRAPTHDTIGAANDVTFIRSLLLQSGWLPQNIKALTDEQATGPATRQGLAWLASKSKPGTFTFFHYSGHVKQTGGHEKLWPVDRDFINDTDVAAILRQGTGKMWVNIAGCEAGGFVEDLPSGNRLVTTSSLATQKSYEYPQWGESVWAGLVFDLGLGQGRADANGNGVTTVGEALRYAQYYAQAITIGQRPYGRQTPQVFGDPVMGWTLEDPPA